MTISYWLDQSFRKKSTSDVVIIGGGISGLSTAFWLEKEDSSLKITLIEKGPLGSGATGRSAGFITCGSVEHFNRMAENWGIQKARKIWQFSEKNLQLLKTHIIEKKELFFQQKGSFSLASTEEEFKELKASYELMKSLNISVEALSEKDIQKRLHSEGFVGGIKYIDDASIHPIKLLEAVRQKLKKTSVFENEEVHNISFKSQSQNYVIKTNKQEIESSFLIHATNAYAPLLENYFKNKIYPTRGQILTTEPAELFLEAPCYANFVLDYFRQLPTGEVLIGGFRQLQKDAEIGYGDQTSEEIQKALEDFLNKHLPKIRGKKITHRWSGVMGFSSDGLPLIGNLPHQSQSYFISGFTAHGLGLAFHCAQKLVDLIFGRQIDEFISAKRFSS